MTPPTNLKSLLAKLRNEARKRGLPANLMLLFYFQERFLARVAQSRYRDSFIRPLAQIKANSIRNYRYLQLD